MTVRSFEASIDLFNSKLASRLSEVAINVCFVAAENIIIGGEFGNPTGTPVDTGYARGQWTPGIGDPSYRESPVDPAGGVAASTAMNVARRLPLGESFWLVNGAKYIVNLENGGSRQAPLGMVGPVVASAQQLVNHVVSEMSK